ncbi:MAG TPA: 2-oxoacid:ferredoxin oxidoreductase subunit gamma [Candidatus Latescibacteria bacterium]|nr:2-oxoacid:ferredoxin oxidoreductase subunit gamma [Candidatus Latescibacterota bacterium]
MYTEVFIAGRGGQGVLVMGTLLAYAAMTEGREVSYFPVYGAEVRGGLTQCSVMLSDQEIASPIVEEPDVLVLMDPGLLEQFGPSAKPGGTIFLSAEAFPEDFDGEGRTCVSVPALVIAMERWSVRSANMVMLGVVGGKTGIVRLRSLQEALGRLQKGDLLKANREALALGYWIGEKGL